MGLEDLGLKWGLRSWNELDRDQLGVGKIGWELEWISIKKEIVIGLNKCKLRVKVIRKIE